MELSLLQTLSPAECLVLKDQSYVRMRDMLKLTLIDLVLKEVLLLGSREVQASPRDPVRKNTYIFIGPNYKKQKLKLHEQLFLLPFDKNPDARFFLRTFVKIVVQEAGNQEGFIRKYIKRSPEFSRYLERNFLTWLQSKIKLNSPGKSRYAQLLKELDVLENKMPELIKYENRAELIALTQSLGGNLFLLHNAHPEMMKEIDQAIRSAMQTIKTGTSDTDTVWYVDYYWPYYSDYDATFDSGYDAASSGGSWGSGDSTGWGDSGCSGCGGCGGCGS